MLLGFDTSDDAAVYRLNDDTAAVLTLDFFTPVVDDPYEFGAIAAANALSDVFAMGAKPLTALNILEDDEPKYGLSVFGTVHPDRIVRNGGAQPGDALFYTKVLGSGIMNSAFRAGLEDDEGMRPVIASMMELNKAGSEAMAAAHVHAATDVTGFGLAGHLHEMLDASNASAELVWDDLPLFEGVYRYSCDFCRPAKTFGIIDWARAFVRQGGLGDEEFENRMGVLCDPQTSGGLLVAVAPDEADEFARAFEAAAGRAPALIGRVRDGAAGEISMK